MSQLNAETVGEKLAVLLFTLTGESAKSFGVLSLGLGDRQLSFPESGFRTLSELSDYMKTEFPSLSEATRDSVLTVDIGSEAIHLPLSEVDVIFEHLKNGGDVEPKLSEDGEKLLDSLSSSLDGFEKKSLEKYIEDVEAARRDEIQAAASPENTGKKAAPKPKPEKSKPKAALPEEEEPEDTTDYSLLDDLPGAVNGGAEAPDEAEDSILEEEKQEDQRTQGVVDGPMPQGNAIQNSDKRYVGSGGLTSAVKKQLGTELETLSLGEKDFSKPMKDFLTRLRELNRLTDELYPDENGMCKPMSLDDARKLKGLYSELSHMADTMTCTFSDGYQKLNSADKAYLKTVKGVQAFLENDNNALRDVDPKKLEGKLLPKALWVLRTKKIRINEKDVVRVGGTMSTRLPLLIDGEERFVTPITNYDADNKKSFEEIRKRIADENPAVSDALYSLKVDDPLDFIQTTLGDHGMTCEKTPTELYNSAKNLIKGDVDPSFWAGPFKQLYEETSRVCRQNIEMAQVGASKGSSISLRSLAVSEVYRMFGCGKYIPNTGTLILNGKPYIYMARAQGSDADRPTIDDNLFEWVAQAKKSQIPGKPLPLKVSGNAAKHLMDSQAMDYICGNVDRHVKNFLYRFTKDENGELVLDGLENIDNDMSFGTKTKEQLAEDIGDGTRPKMGTQYYCRPEDFRYFSKSVVDYVKEKVRESKEDEPPESLKNGLLAKRLSDAEVRACWERVKDIHALITRREMINEAMEKKLVYTPDDWKESGAPEKYGKAYREYAEKRDKYVKDKLDRYKRENPDSEHPEAMLEMEYEDAHPFTIPITDPKQRKEKIRQMLNGKNFKLKLSDGTEIKKKDWDETPEILSDAEIKAIDWTEHINEISPDGKNSSHPDYNTNYFHRVKDAVHQVNTRRQEYEKDFGDDKKPLEGSKGTLSDKLEKAKTDLENLLKKEAGDGLEVALDGVKDFERIRQHAIRLETERRIIKYTPVKVIDETKSPTDLGSIKAKLNDMDKKLKANDPFFHKNTDEYKKLRLALDNALAGLNAEDATEENMLDQFAALRDAAKTYIEKKGANLRTFDFGTARLEVAKELNALAQEKTEMVQNRATRQALYMYDKCKELGNDEDSGFAAIMKGAAKGFRGIAKGAKGDLSGQVGEMKKDNSFTLDCMMIAAAVVKQRENNAGQPGTIEQGVKEGAKEFLKNVHRSKEMIKARKGLTGKDLFALTVMDRFDCLADPTKAPKLPGVWERALVKSGRIIPLKPTVQKEQPVKPANGLAM